MSQAVQRASSSAISGTPGAAIANSTTLDVAGGGGAANTRTPATITRPSTSAMEGGDEQAQTPTSVSIVATISASLSRSEDGYAPRRMRSSIHASTGMRSTSGSIPR